ARALPRKLDADLLQLLSEEIFAADATFPVIVTAEEGQFDQLEQLVLELRGEPRHRLSAIGAISAWLTARAIAELSTSDLVAGVELSQPMRIA
ncbi:MAG: hypothetical protein WD995_03940, partial [Gemmatimonadota bacterium]